MTVISLPLLALAMHFPVQAGPAILALIFR